MSLQGFKERWYSVAADFLPQSVLFMGNADLYGIESCASAMASETGFSNINIEKLPDIEKEEKTFCFNGNKACAVMLINQTRL